MRAPRPETEDFVERAPTRIVVSREVGASAERVFDTLADAPGWPTWFPQITRAEWTSEPGGVGSTRTVHLGGARVAERFVVWDRPRRWGFTFTDARPAFARAGVELVELEPLGAERTRVTYTMALELAGPLVRVRAGFARAARRGLEQGLDGLDAFLTGALPRAEDPAARRSRLGLAALMLTMGTLHFAAPAPFARIVPHRLGHARGWVHASGIAELVSGVLLLGRRTRRAGGLAAAATMVAVFPANVQMALDTGAPRAARPATFLPWLRLPLQAPLVAWALRVRR